MRFQALRPLSIHWITPSRPHRTGLKGHRFYCWHYSSRPSQPQANVPNEYRQASLRCSLLVRDVDVV